MFNRSSKCAGAVLMLLLAFSQPAIAQTGNATDTVYWPGYVATYVPLSLFLPQSLRPACKLLTEGDLIPAENAFATELRFHPNDLAAYVGYLQAARGHRDVLLQKYEQEAKASESPVAAFKLAMLAYYQLGEQWHDYSPARATQKRYLASLASWGFQRAFSQTQEPIAGFMLAGSVPYLKPAPGKNDLGIYEVMLKSLGGRTVYQAYLQAKNGNWEAPQPPIPLLSKDKLAIFKMIVGMIYSQHGGQRGVVTGHHVSGQLIYQTTYAPLTAEQEQAMAYLKEWSRRIGAAIKADKPTQ